MLALGGLMNRQIIRLVAACGLLATAVWVAPQLAGQSRSSMPSTANGEWPMYTADLRGSKYSPLDQINASNFDNLEVAWTFKTDNLGPRPENKLEGTPIMVNGTLYATGGTSRSVVALDPDERPAEVGLSPGRGRAGQPVGAAPAVGPRPLVLDRRPGRRAHPVRDDRVPAGGTEREDRPAGGGVRRSRHRRHEGRRGDREQQAGRSRERGDRAALDADGGRATW